jgi:hypothetical protein
MRNPKQKIKEKFAAMPDNDGFLPNKNCSSYEAEVAECRVALLMARRSESRL